MPVNQQNGFPLYYRTFPGSVPDVATVRQVLREYAGLDLNRKASLVADRGCGSVKNLHKLYQDRRSFIFNLRTGLSICRRLIDSHYQELIDDCHYDVKLGNSYITEQVSWSYPLNSNTNTSRARHCDAL